MRTTFILLLLVLSLDLRAQDNAATVSALHRLEGRWRADVAGKGASSRKELIEAWRSMPDGSMLGWSGTSVGTGVRKDEDLTISKRKGRWTYTATVMRQNGGRPVAFTCTSSTPTSVVFENTKHDFPQKIEYVFVTSDSMVATVSGKGRSFALHFRRIPNHVYAYTSVKFDEKGHFSTELPSPTEPRPTIERFVGAWSFDTTALRLRLVKKSKDRFEGSLTLPAVDLKTYGSYSIVLKRSGKEWTLTMKRRGWNHDQPAVYTLEHASANTLIFQCHHVESPNNLHIEFDGADTIWLSSADIIDVGGEHGGQGSQFNRERSR
jgi:hypothetical protein